MNVSAAEEVGDLTALPEMQDKGGARLSLNVYAAACEIDICRVVFDPFLSVAWYFLQSC